MRRTPKSLHGDDANVLFGRSIDDVTNSRPSPVVVSEHHDIEAVAFDGRVRDFLEVGSVCRYTEKSDFPLILESIESFVSIFVHQSLDTIA